MGAEARYRKGLEGGRDKGEALIAVDDKLMAMTRAREMGRTKAMAGKGLDGHQHGRDLEN